MKGGLFYEIGDRSIDPVPYRCFAEGSTRPIRWRYYWGESKDNVVRGVNLMRVQDGKIIEASFAGALVWRGAIREISYARDCLTFLGSPATIKS